MEQIETYLPSFICSSGEGSNEDYTNSYFDWEAE